VAPSGETFRQFSDVCERVLSTLDVDALLGVSTEAALELTPADAAHLWLEEEEGRLRLVAWRSLPHRTDVLPPRLELQRGDGIVGRVVAHRAPRHSADLLGEPLDDVDAWLTAAGYSSQIAVPVAVGSRALGALVVLAREWRRFGASTVERLQALGVVVARALETARAHRRARGRAERLAALSARADVIARASGRALADGVAEAAVALLAGRSAHVWMAHDHDAVLRIAGGFGAGELAEPPEADGRELRPHRPGLADVGRGREIVDMVFESRQPEYVPDVTVDVRWIGAGEAPCRPGGAYAAIPLVSGERALGVLTLAFDERRPFDDDDRELLQLLAGHAATAMEHDRLQRDMAGRSAQLERLARVTTDSLAAKNAEMDTFLYSVSHDLKAPLVAVQGLAGALLEDHGERLDDRGRHYLARLEANVLQMERLIDDLLRLSRVGRESRRPEAVSLADVVDGVVREVDHPCRCRAVTLVVGALHTVRGVRAQVEQVMRELVSNAVTYLGDTPCPRIEIGSEWHGGEVECWVKDNGIGIDVEYHRKVFEVFHRLKEVDAAGSGVGLAVVKKIVEGAGGRVWVESARGRGATFRFTWPAASTGSAEGEGCAELVDGIDRGPIDAVASARLKGVANS
jgi:signal transduction histidine kinase